VSGIVAKLTFLSDEWIDEARRIRAEYQDRSPAIPVTVRMNLNVKGGPDGGVLRAHLDTSSGQLDIDVEHIESADLTLTVDAETAKSILLGGDPQVAMSAFMGGRIKVDGDISKLLELVSQGGVGIEAPNAKDRAMGDEVVSRLHDITA
jgi:hypothetical protein